MKLIQIKILAVAIFCVVILSFTNSNSYAYNNLADNDGDSTKTIYAKTIKKKLEPAGNYGAVFGGCNSKNTGGLISKSDFINLLSNPICGTDNKTNTNYIVASFDLTYCEKQVSEDSTGYPTIVTDCTMEPIDGDAFPQKWKKVFTERIYKGDSIKIDNIRVRNGALKYKSKNNLIFIIKD